MKKLLISSTLLVGLPLMVLGQGISGSAHDFSGNGWSGGQICIVCHTPHNADATVAESPAWRLAADDGFPPVLVRWAERFEWQALAGQIAQLCEHYARTSPTTVKLEESV